MNLEIKDDNEEIWDYIQILIGNYEYYSQISICGFNHNYYEKVIYRTIVFGFLNWNPLFYNRPNHQISINTLWYKNIPEIVQLVHYTNMAVGL